MTLTLAVSSAHATDYVTQAEHDQAIAGLLQSLNGQISNGIDYLNGSISAQLAAMAEETRAEAREIKAQTVIALAHAAAPDPEPRNGRLGFSAGVASVGGDTALSLRAGNDRWSVGVSGGRGIVALTAGARW